MTVRPRRRSRQTQADAAPQGVASVTPLRAVVSFEAFYEREIRSVIGLAYALSGSSSAAEDLAQDAFLAAHRDWDRISRYDRPEAWVRRVVSNLAVSLFRRTVREARAIARIARPSVILPELPAEADEFWGAVRSLPKRQAQAVALHYLEDRPVAEIAEILECTESTVKVHLFKGRRRLAGRLGLDEGGMS